MRIPQPTVAAPIIVCIVSVSYLLYIHATDTTNAANTPHVIDASDQTTAEEPGFLAEVPQDKYGAMVRLGYKLFTETPKYAKRYSGNKLACASCHLDAGRRPEAAPMGPAFVAYPSWRETDERLNTFDDRVQHCFRYSLNGIPPARGSVELQALTAYASWLAQGLPMGEPMIKGRGLYQIPKTGNDPSHDRGRVIYSERCAACHGTDGEGTDGALPVWGLNSYNRGAGMYVTKTLAGFIKKNMPVGDATLSDQESLDVAAYVNFQFHPYDPRRGVLDVLAK